MKTVAIIRERGQLTIPDSIRKQIRWITTSSVVSISMEKPDELIIMPHKMINEIEWERLFEIIKKSREFKGRGNVSASDFIAKVRDR